MSNIKLETKLVGEISGRFLIPSYQRGYRWGKDEVEMLLKDIVDNGDKPYSLQPIVVRNLGDSYELVDGQQRLTTLYLIFKYFQKSGMGFIQDDMFTLSYQTRIKSEEFLRDITPERKEENIDFFHIVNAFEEIGRFFDAQPNKIVAMFNTYKYLNENVKVIWYEIPEEESPVDLFTRLNIGKIPLTSSELVKALFLRADAKDVVSRQDEISLQWDNIERDLHDAGLWAFLTNDNADEYPTRIDLLLDLMAGKTKDKRDDYYTFFHFDKRTDEKLYDIWKDIQHTFLTLKEWRYNHEFYHKMGYLIASGYKTLAQIYSDTRNLQKTQIRYYLDDCIRESIAIEKAYEELSYDISYDQTCIHRLLLLFNVESVRTIDGGRQWFPFDKHKNGDWSLEHIHAQHSEGLDTNEKRDSWLKAHSESLKNLSGEAAEHAARLIGEIYALRNDIKDNPKTGKIGDRFRTIQEEVSNLLSPAETEYIHTLSNMALLDSGDNAALSNYVFDAKRNIVIGWDKGGKYIPFCTKMVFFKYYTPSGQNQLHFWGAPDREAYLKAIKDKLAQYLNQPESSESE